MHRDLKLDNLLLDADDNLLLADFGFAASIASTRRLKLLCGSPHYSAPEIFAQQEYSGTAADMWSLGVLMYTMLNTYEQMLVQCQRFNTSDSPANAA